jgi:hypothetical protein
MPSNAITRRRVLAAGITTSAALALGRLAATIEAAPAEIQTFYDPRFGSSKELARRFPSASQLQAIAGDASQLLSRLAPDIGALRPLRLQGVTTETIPFCLEQLIRGHRHDVRLQSRRLDRDLFAWTLTVRARA